MFSTIGIPIVPLVPFVFLFLYASNAFNLYAYRLKQSSLAFPVTGFSHLLPEIKVGYHAHNNFQLGFSNAKTFLAANTERDILADGTLYGMGKSAGNAPLELLMMFMNEKLGRGYDITQALEAIDIP